jgi:hypothetical protein
LGNARDLTNLIAAIIDNNVALTASGTKILSLRTNGSEKAYVDKDGVYTGKVTLTGDSGFASGNNGNFYLQGGKLIQGAATVMAFNSGVSSGTGFNFNAGNSTTWASINATGGFRFNVQGAASPTCDSTTVRTCTVVDGGTGADHFDCCMQAADASGGGYAWRAIYTVP